MKYFFILLCIACSLHITKDTENVNIIYLQYEADIIVDYSLPSHTKRMFIKHENVIIDSFLVASGKTDKNNQVIFSNVEGSNCSSKGKATIGNKYIGNYGTAYKLHGKDKTNSNMYKRYVVLHCHSCVPQSSLFPICKSQGCLTVNCDDLKTLSYYIDSLHLKSILVL